MMIAMKNAWWMALLASGFSLAPCPGQTEKPPLVICCAGDSLMRPMPTLFRELLPPSLPNLSLQEWAQGGLSSVTYQSYYRQHAGRWRQITPDFILVQLGTNDVVPLLEGRTTTEDFKSHMTSILREFLTYRNASGKTPFLLVATIPFFSDDPANKDRNRVVREAVNPAIREVVKKTGALLVDNCAVMENRPDVHEPDGVHPNLLGGTDLAKNWVKAMKACLLEKD